MFNKCKKYYNTKSSIIDIKGITANIPKESEIFSIGLGEISIKPDYVEATKELRELDQMQVGICESIKKVKNKEEKDKLQIEFAKTLLKMLSISSNPNETKIIKQNKIVIIGNENIAIQDTEGKSIKITSNSHEGIKELSKIGIVCKNNEKIKSAIDIRFDDFSIDNEFTQDLLNKTIENIGSFTMSKFPEYYVSIRKLDREKQIEELAYNCWRDDKLEQLINFIRETVPGLFKTFIKF